MTTGSNSKSFGDICYNFVIFLLNVEDYMTEELLLFLSHEHFPFFFFLISFINCAFVLFCIHMLAGSRLLYVLQNLNNFKKVNGKYDSRNLKDFIPKKKYRISYSNIVSNLKQVISGKSDSTLTENSSIGNCTTSI